MQDKTIQLHDRRIIGYSDYGKSDATPIMLFHGTPGSRICGLEKHPMLERFGIRIISPERPGYGLSDPKIKRTIINWADDVKELADYLGINKFHIAGESGGGPYVLACAFKMPTRVLSATLIGSSCPPEVLRVTKGMTFGNKIGFFFARHLPFVLKIASANFAAAIEKYPDKVMHRLIDQLCEWDKQIIKKNGEQKRKTLLLHFEEAFRQGSDGHFEDSVLVANPWGFDIGEIKVPVLMWHGEDDNLMPVRPAKEFSKLIPNCESFFIPKAGHLLLESEDVGIKILSKLLAFNT